MTIKSLGATLRSQDPAHTHHFPYALLSDVQATQIILRPFFPSFPSGFFFGLFFFRMGG